MADDKQKSDDQGQTGGAPIPPPQAQTGGTTPPGAGAPTPPPPTPPPTPGAGTQPGGGTPPPGGYPSQPTPGGHYTQTGYPPAGYPQDAYQPPQWGGYPPPPPGGYPPPPPGGYPPPPPGGYPSQGGAYPPGGYPPPPPEDTTPANFQIGTKFPAKLNVNVPKHSLNFDEEYFIRLLAGSISLSKDEKAKIIESIPKLKQAQIDELIRIFEEEKQKFAALSKKHVPQLEKLAEQHYQEWMDLETEQQQSSKKQEDQGKADEIRKNLGL